MNDLSQSPARLALSARHVGKGLLDVARIVTTRKLTLIAAVATIVAAVSAPFYPVWFVPYVSTIVLFSTIIALVLIGIIVDTRLALSRGPFKPGLFAGPRPADQTSSWKRTIEHNDLCQLIESTQNSAVVVFGPSGVGKSHLLSTNISQQYDDNGWLTHIQDTYSLLDVTLSRAIREKLLKKNHKDIHEIRAKWDGTNPPLLLILDQFEQFIDHSTEHEQDWLRKFCNSSLQLANFRLVIVIREDWSRQCQRLLKQWGISVKEYDLYGIRPDFADQSFAELNDKMIDATGDNATAQKVLSELTITKVHRPKEIFPVAAQIVGQVLENLRREKYNTGITLDVFETLGRTQGIITLFFQRSIDVSPYPDTALAVLFALSVHNRLHRAAKLNRLFFVTHHHPKRVRACVTYFEACGLIKARRDGFIELSHDFIAEQLNELTGRSLPAAERDNVLYFSENLDFEINKPNLSVPADKRVWFAFGDLILLVGLAHSIRLLDSWMRGQWSWANIGTGIFSSPVEIYSIGVWACCIAWMLNVLFLYRRVLVNIKEPSGGKLFSILIVLVFLTGGIVLAFFPHMLALLLSIAGIIWGFKFLSLSYFGKYAIVSKQYFREEAFKIMYISVFCAILGALFIYYLLTVPISDETISHIKVVVVFGTITILVFAWRSWQNHVRWSAVAVILGQFDRGRGQHEWRLR